MSVDGLHLLNLLAVGLGKPEGDDLQEDQETKEETVLYGERGCRVALQETNK